MSDYLPAPSGFPPANINYQGDLPLSEGEAEFAQMTDELGGIEAVALLFGVYRALEVYIQGLSSRDSLGA